MPTPSRTSVEEIVGAGRRIVEAEGLEGLTMQGVATAVGVKAPSLYKHVGSRGELIKLIIESVVKELGFALDEAVAGEDPQEDLRSMAYAFRDFARSHPHTYRIVFAPMPDEWVPDPTVLMAGSEAVLRTTAVLAVAGNALDAARLVTAWIHGFMTMELSGAFRMEGDLDQAFEFAVARLGEALSAD